MKKVSDFTTRLNQLFDTTEVSAVDIASKTGISPAAISRYRTGQRSIRSDYIEMLAKAFDVPVAWIMGYEDDDTATTITIPVISKLQPSKPLFAEGNIEDYLTVPSEWGVGFAYRTTDDSMGDAGIPKGAIVLCRKQPSVNDNAVALTVVDDSRTVLARVKRQGSLLLLQPENPEYDVLFFPDKEKSRVKIVGVVLKILRDI